MVLLMRLMTLAHLVVISVLRITIFAHRWLLEVTVVVVVLVVIIL